MHPNLPTKSHQDDAAIARDQATTKLACSPIRYSTTVVLPTSAGTSVLPAAIATPGKLQACRPPALLFPPPTFLGPVAISSDFEFDCDVVTSAMPDPLWPGKLSGPHLGVVRTCQAPSLSLTNAKGTACAVPAFS